MCGNTSASRNRRPLRPGFTLIELLVVVAVISVLMSILLPGLRAARDQAKRVACQANLNGLGKAWWLYLADSRDRYPVMGDASSNYGGLQGAHADYQVPKPLNPYVGLPLETDVDAEIFRCPADRGDSSVKPTAYAWLGTSYWPNAYVVGHRPELFNTKGVVCPLINQHMKNDKTERALFNIVSASRTLLLGDYGWHMVHNGAWRWPEWHRRDERFNMLFVDGHVDEVRICPDVKLANNYDVWPYEPHREYVKDVQGSLCP